MVTLKFHREIKGRFRKRVVLANVPSFRFSFRGNMRTYPRSGFSFRGNIRTYPRSGFRSGGTSAKTTFLETTLLGSSDYCFFAPKKSLPLKKSGPRPVCSLHFGQTCLCPQLRQPAASSNKLLGANVVRHRNRKSQNSLRFRRANPNPTPKETRGFLFAERLKSLETKGKRPKKQGKSQHEESNPDPPILAVFDFVL